MLIHLFGASTATGEALRQQIFSSPSDWTLVAYSRRSPSMFPVNFSDPATFHFGGEHGAPGLLISFVPIWLLSIFLERLALDYPGRLQGLSGVIACSSSSAITKRFAANRFDRHLVAQLSGAEDQLLATCRCLQMTCHILQPTLIYGQAGPYGDRNLSSLIKVLRRLPCLPLPVETGLRQPIHASQLAAVSLNIAEQLRVSGCEPSLEDRITLGGDTTLTYANMVSALQQAQAAGDPARRCRLLPIPNRLFFSLSAPLLMRSPKAFEAVLRIGANLSGFTPAHQLLGRQPQPFPVLPLAG